MGDKVIYVSWTVTINGKTLSTDRKECIDSISIEENCDGSDTCTLTVNDPEFVFVEDNIFIEDVPVTITLGLDKEPTPYVFSGYISAIDITFPSEGIPQLSLFCLDKTHLMNRKKKNRSWDNTTKMAVARKIATEYGLKFVGQKGYDGEVEETLSQSDQTDIEFLESMASDEKPDIYQCKVSGSTLYYGKKGILGKSVANLHYKEYPWDIVSFSPKINKETVSEETSSSDVSTGTKATDSATASSSTATNTKNGEAVTTSSKPTNTELITYDPEKGNWSNDKSSSSNKSNKNQTAQ